MTLLSSVVLLEVAHSSTLKVPILSGFCGLPCMVVKRWERVAPKTSPTIGNVDLELSSLSLPSVCYVVSRWTSSTGKSKTPTHRSKYNVCARSVKLYLTEENLDLIQKSRYLCYIENEENQYWRMNIAVNPLLWC